MFSRCMAPAYFSSLFNVTLNPSPIGFGPSAAIICRRLCEYTVMTKCWVGGCWWGYGQYEAISSRTEWKEEVAQINTEGGANASCGVHCISESLGPPLPVDLPIGIEVEILSVIDVEDQERANGCCNNLVNGTPNPYGLNPDTIWEDPRRGRIGVGYARLDSSSSANTSFLNCCVYYYWFCWTDSSCNREKQDVFRQSRSIRNS